MHVDMNPYIMLRLSNVYCEGVEVSMRLGLYGLYGAGKSLDRPGRKQARKHVRDARFQQHWDASCHQVFFPARQGAEGNSRHSDRNNSLFPSWSG